MQNICPLGPHLQKYWERLSPIEQKMQMDEEGLYSLTPQIYGERIADRTNSRRVIDAFCGLGGSAIAFARQGKLVTAFDINEDRLQMALYNAELFDVCDKIEFRLSDCGVVLSNLNGQEAVFLDPPWGGPSYSAQAEFHFADFVVDCLSLLDICLKSAGEVILRLPKNFAMKDLEQFREKFELEDSFYENQLFFRTAFFRKSEAD